MVEIADFLLKWGNQRYNCGENASSATAMAVTWEKNIHLGILIFLDAEKIKFVGA